MKKYYIQSKVSTGTDIFPNYNGLENDIEKRVDCSFEYDGLKFTQWAFSFAQGPHGDAWIVANEINAENFVSAVNLHFKKLSQVLTRVFFSVPVWHSFGFHESLLISNDKFQTGFYFMRKEREGTGLTITSEILEFLNNQSFKNITDKFFLYYSEFINANTALSGLSLGLGALEIIRPEKNEDRIKLFGDKLYYKIYGKIDNKFPERKEGIRHKIHHGRYPEEGDNSENDTKDMHEAIKLCLLNINPDIQRIYDLRSNFVAIPRQKKVIEGHNGIYLFSDNQKSLNLKDIMKYDDTAVFEFQRRIKENLSISIDTSKRSNDY